MSEQDGEIKAYREKKAGDLLLATDWNELQIAIKEEIQELKKNLEKQKQDLEDSKNNLKADFEKRLPAGTIVMWSGNTLPDGWILCDGEKGTPNLADRFILGAASIPIDPNKKSGEGDRIDFNVTIDTTEISVPPSEIWKANDFEIGKEADDKKINLAKNFKHKHQITLDLKRDPVKPRYYILAFIMKL